MKIFFTEVERWEEETLKKTFPDAVFTKDKLSLENVKNYTDTEIACSFIYSKFDEAVLSQLPALKMIATRSTGFDHINLDYAKAHGITVCNVPEYGSHTVAEHTFALLLALTRKLAPSIQQVRNMDFEHQNLIGTDIFGKTLGIIGLGKIGMNVLHMAKGFGMNVQVYARHPDEELAKKEGFTNMDLDTLLATSDVITLHVPYSKETHHIINCGNFSKIKKGAYLLNTARGGLIETQAIIEGLQKNMLAGVGLDVLEEETQMMEEVEILSAASDVHALDMKTLLMNHVLLYHPNVIITPHNAFNSHEALMNILTTTLENIQSFEKGMAINEVKPH
jgi:D-lactate dehydrogenase